MIVETETLNQEATNKPTEVIYKKAGLGKRMFAHFIDVSFFILSSFILFSIINIPVTHSSWYKEKSNRLAELRNETGLYIDGQDIITYVENNEEYDSYTKRKDELSSRIDIFYSNQTYFKDLEDIQNKYDKRRLEAKDGDNYLFVMNEGVVEESAIVSHESLYNFYKNEISNYSYGYFFNNPEYSSLVRFTFATGVVQFVCIIIVTYTIFFLIPPLTFYRRGRQTFGMKLAHIALISIRADNITSGKIVLRIVFNFFVFVPLNFVGFLIPTFVSITMMYTTKTNSSLTNYVFNDYMVDITDQKIYLNALEMEESKFKLQEMSIENKDLRLK